MIILGLDVEKHPNVINFSMPAKWGDREKFIRQVVLQYDGDDCILWPYARAGKGYAYTTIKGRCKQAHRYICRIVNGDPPDPSYDAAHSCGRGFDGCVTWKHLSWKTRKENAADKHIHDTNNHGERNGSCKLKEFQVLEAMAMKGSLSQREIGNIFGVSSSTIGLIHRGEKWSWLTGVVRDE